MAGLLTLVVAAGGKVIHKVAEEVMQLREKQRLGFRDERKQKRGRGARAAAPPGPLGWKTERRRVTPPPHPAHLDLVLLPRVLYGLEDAPGAVPSHLQARHVAPVPSLDEGCCPEGCDREGRESL